MFEVVNVWGGDCLGGERLTILSGNLLYLHMMMIKLMLMVMIFMLIVMMIMLAIMMITMRCGVSPFGYARKAIWQQFR